MRKRKFTINTANNVEKCVNIKKTNIFPGVWCHEPSRRKIIHGILTPPTGFMTPSTWINKGSFLKQIQLLIAYKNMN